MAARLLLGFRPAQLLTDGIIGDRHEHIAAWWLFYGVLFGTALWAADRLRTSPISARRWWLAVVVVIVGVTALPEPVDLVFAALSLAVLSALAARASR